MQRLARKQGLWNRVKKTLPARKDPTQGFQTEAVLAAQVFGLLAGGRGFSATEPMRNDTTLKRMMGQDDIPSAETVEGVTKYLAAVGAINKINQVLQIQTQDTMADMDQKDLYASSGMFPVWADGTLLEVTGRKFDNLKRIDGKYGQMCCAVFCGPLLAGIDFAQNGQGEETVSMALLENITENLLRKKKMLHKAIFLLDSLYGDDSVLTRLESYSEKPLFIVGLQKLKRPHSIMNELPEAVWINTGAISARGWAESAVAQAYIQCDNWENKRLMVCRRWKRAGDIFWNYAAVAVPTWACEHEKIIKSMNANGTGFEETIWSLYDYKQGMENHWKELLADMGLHNPPCAKAAVNAVFYAIAAMAYNLAVGVRYLGMQQGDKRMRLARLRRHLIDLAAYVVHHGRKVVTRFLDAREDAVRCLLGVMERLADL
jgi:hypothetical protein